MTEGVKMRATTEGWRIFRLVRGGYWLLGSLTLLGLVVLPISARTSLAANIPPTVTITTPKPATDGVTRSITTDRTPVLTATATDPDGAVASVEFQLRPVTNPTGPWVSVGVVGTPVSGTTNQFSLEATLAPAPLTTGD